MFLVLYSSLWRRDLIPARISVTSSRTASQEFGRKPDGRPEFNASCIGLATANSVSAHVGQRPNEFVRTCGRATIYLPSPHTGMRKLTNRVEKKSRSKIIYDTWPRAPVVIVTKARMAGSKEQALAMVRKSPNSKRASESA